MIDEILEHWNVQAVTLRNDIPLAGSPERCAMRVAVEDRTGGVYILERLSPGQKDRREAIATILEELAESGLAQSMRYLSCESGAYVIAHRGEHYMLAPLIPGGPPPRPDLVHHGWRGKCLGAFLIDFAKAASGVSKDSISSLGAPLDLPAYTESLAETIRLRRPNAHTRLATSLERLKPFLQTWDTLPKHLCHGDYHPLNIIWSSDSVSGVIDWEFTGLKPVLYDAANCVGCVGSEGPEALTGGFILEFVASLKDAGWDLALLPETVAALRVGWLSEWLRRSDEEMIDLELDYLALLTHNLDRLRAAWAVG